MGKKVLGQGKKGLLYFAQNPAFRHLVKIGMTTELDVADRGLSNSSVPDDFDYIKVFQCDDAQWAENCVHNRFAQFRHISNTGRKTEFFWSGCINEAIEYAEELKGVVVTESETEDVAAIDDKGEKVIVKRPNKDFYSMGLKDGDEIFLIKKPELKAVICGAKLVSYNGSKPMKITTLSNKLFIEHNLGVPHLGGFEYFAFDNQENLYDRYNRMTSDRE